MRTFIALELPDAFIDEAAGVARFCEAPGTYGARRWGSGGFARRGGGTWL